MEIYQKYNENQWNSVNALLLLPSPCRIACRYSTLHPCNYKFMHCSIEPSDKHPIPQGGGGKQQLLIALALYLNLASLLTITGLLPPSSSVIGQSCSAAAFITILPTAELPVKKMYSHFCFNKN